MYLSDIGEHGFIKMLRVKFPMASAGDDAAVLSSIKTPVVTTDSFFEGTHFFRWWTSPAVLAKRLLEATLSDVAAMGGEPVSVLSSVMLPPDIEVEWLLDFYEGLTSREDCPVVGGETIRGTVFGITLTAIGECGENKPLLRSSVKPGDSIWVTGPLGRSFNSPELLQKSRNQTLSAAEKEQTILFLTPEARFDTLLTLRKCGVQAAIDVSDGLFSECRHLACESGVRINLELEKVPQVPYTSLNPRGGATAGEDFELLFSLPSSSPLPGDGFFRVGFAIEGEGLLITDDGSQLEIPVEGYDHFTASSQQYLKS